MPKTSYIVGLCVCVPVWLAPPPAQANMWVCQDRDRGGTAFVNSAVKNENRRRYRKCKLAMDFGADTKGSVKSRSSSASTRRTKKRSNFKPPAIGESPTPKSDNKTLNERIKLYLPYIEEASSKYDIPVHFIRAVMRVESRFNYKAVSPVGAQGLMQLMPGTAREMGVNDAFDPRQNIMGGTRLLRWLANRHDGDLIQVLSAYNAGAGAVKRKGGAIPYEGTEAYVRAVLKHYYRYKDQLDAPTAVIDP